MPVVRLGWLAPARQLEFQYKVKLRRDVRGGQVHMYMYIEVHVYTYMYIPTCHEEAVGDESSCVSTVHRCRRYSKCKLCCKPSCIIPATQAYIPTVCVT